MKEIYYDERTHVQTPYSIIYLLVPSGERVHFSNGQIYSRVQSLSRKSSARSGWGILTRQNGIYIYRLCSEQGASHNWK